jgi:hypothetical protein
VDVELGIDLDAELVEQVSPASGSCGHSATRRRSRSAPSSGQHVRITARR